MSAKTGFDESFTVELVTDDYISQLAKARARREKKRLAMAKYRSNKKSKEAANSEAVLLTEPPYDPSAPIDPHSAPIRRSCIESRNWYFTYQGAVDQEPTVPSSSTKQVDYLAYCYKDGTYHGITKKFSYATQFPLNIGSATCINNNVLLAKREEFLLHDNFTEKYFSAERLAVAGGDTTGRKRTYEEAAKEGRLGDIPRRLLSSKRGDYYRSLAPEPAPAVTNIFNNCTNNITYNLADNGGNK